jgi:hypothetical protein
VFLCRDEFEAHFFVDMNNTGGPVDVWEVTGIAEHELITWETGFCYYPATIPPARLTLIAQLGHVWRSERDVNLKAVRTTRARRRAKRP